MALSRDKKIPFLEWKGNLLRGLIPKGDKLPKKHRAFLCAIISPMETIPKKFIAGV